MAASLRPIAVEVSQLATSLVAASDVTAGGRTVRGQVAIAGTASTSEPLVKPVAWKKRGRASWWALAWAVGEAAGPVPPEATLAAAAKPRA